MSKKPSLKKAVAEVKKAVFCMSADDTLSLEQGVIQPFEQVVANHKNSEELKHLIAENLASILGTTPSYELWNACHDNTEKAVITSMKIEEATFKNIWASIVKLLGIMYDLEKPKAKSAEAIKKATQREKAKTMTGLDGKDYLVSEIDDANLEKLFGLRGKAELVNRELANEKESEKLQVKAKKANADNFLARMKTLVKEKYDFAMFLDGKLADYENDFNAEKN
jgi:nitrogen-specific signal transduction histidine kinase